VPSSKSSPFTDKMSPEIPASSTKLMPIGFGRCGERVANTPRRLSLRGGSTLGRQPSARSNQKMSQM
jgi:hypothetical protein